MNGAPRVALVGAGRMGQVHGRHAAANPRLDLAFLVEPRAEEGGRLAAGLGCALASLEAVLDDPSVAGVLVASSTDTHLEVALAALARGKAVFCEKPLDLDLARLRRHAEELERPAAPLYVAFNRRFDPHFQALKAKVASGAIGALETVNIVSHDPRPPPPSFIPTSGGLFRDFTIHDFDMARWLFDEEPAEVFAVASALTDPAIAAAGDVDTARTLLRFASGRLCAISNSRRSGYGYDQRAEAYGSGGMAAVDNVHVSTLETWTEAGALSAPIFDGFQTRYLLSYAAEMDHFASVLAGEAAPLTGYADSVQALALAEAAERSLGAGLPVRLEDV
jgi:myo-inositol 2-dehydrogenase/D-chiro-inositol 1-dehydrogenase